MSSTKEIYMKLGIFDDSWCAQVNCFRKADAIKNNPDAEIREIPFTYNNCIW